MDLAGKNVVYLGGFGGIGQKVCAELLERQLKVGSARGRDVFSIWLIEFLVDFIGVGRIRSGAE